jgi:transposase
MGTPRYSKEFKAEAVRLFIAGNKPVAQLAKELGVAAKSIRDWAKQAEADAGNGAPGVLTTPERDELIALRKKCRELERERDFLQDAATYFAKTRK